MASALSLDFPLALSARAPKDVEKATSYVSVTSPPEIRTFRAQTIPRLGGRAAELEGERCLKFQGNQRF